ncbi:MAG: hypothetical protein IKH57_04725 [Clostridia bacterium]|nr:hypothetical protein [Clostridia bacterium]
MKNPTISIISEYEQDGNAKNKKSAEGVSSLSMTHCRVHTQLRLTVNHTHQFNFRMADYQGLPQEEGRQRFWPSHHSPGQEDFSYRLRHAFKEGSFQSRFDAKH